eukprot:3140911-Rhodomonas_salina.1
MSGTARSSSYAFAMQCLLCYAATRRVSSSQAAVAKPRYRYRALRNERRAPASSVQFVPGVWLLGLNCVVYPTT